MVQSTVSVGKSTIHLNVAGDTAFVNRLFKMAIELNQTTEESHYQRYHIDGLVTDEAIPMGKVTSPTMILVRFISKLDGENGTVDGDPAEVNVKIATGSAFECKFLMLAVDIDANLDVLTNAITFTTLADSDTTVEVAVLGRST